MRGAGLGRVVALTGALVLASCAADPPTIADPPRGDQRRSTAPPASASPSTSARPEAAEAAVAAYRSYLAATAVASRKPPKVGQPWPAGGDITPFAVDPVLSIETALLHDLGAKGQHFVGVPVTPRPRATGAGERVTVQDCPVPAQGWRLVDANGTTAWSPPSTWAPQPNPITATVVLRDGRWAVSELTVETSRTCTP